MQVVETNGVARAASATEATSFARRTRTTRQKSHVFPGGPPLTRNYRRFRAACRLGAPGEGR